MRQERLFDKISFSAQKPYKPVAISHAPKPHSNYNNVNRLFTKNLVAFAPIPAILAITFAFS
jgi:hypothetical protein